MAEEIQCARHGERQKAYVCTHLGGDAFGLGFNRDEPTAENPFPDAWCDDCEIIREAHGGWDSESEKLIKIMLLCSACYERARMRNTRTLVRLDDLAELRWKCHTCEEWHRGPCLDLGYDAPYYWTDQYQEASRQAELLPKLSTGHRKTFLDEDYCAIDDSDFFVHGIIHLPILGTGETFRWGVWGSLSRENFEALLKRDNDRTRTELPAMFSWLSSQISDYPNTLSLKMWAHVQDLGQRPHFELEMTDHPLAKEYHDGIMPERVKEIMSRHLQRVH
jgi:hypothetical protein